MKNLYKIEDELYIISNTENVSENCWIITNGRLVQVSYLLSNEVAKGNKVILTTNKLLIKDGVQAIDDEFLKWFVVNPNCKHVEVQTSDTSNTYTFKVPLSKEWFPKRKFMEDISYTVGLDSSKDTNIGNLATNICLAGEVFSTGKGILEQQVEVGQITEKGIVDTVGTCANCGVEFHIHKDIKEDVQESIEEVNKAALNYANNDNTSSDDFCKETLTFAFDAGARWQQEQYDTSKVTRVEVIQHSPPYKGRAYVNYDAKNVEISLQDDGRTLKLYL